MLAHEWQRLGEGDPDRRLRPTITICLLKEKRFPEVEDYHLAFGLYNRQHGLCFCDHIQIHLLELAKFNRRSEELRDDLDKWAYCLRHAETLDPDVLPEPLREPARVPFIREFP